MILYPALLAAVAHAAPTNITGAMLFPNTATYHKIVNPAIVRTGDVILAFAEARRVGPDADHIDVVMSRSSSGGNHWSAMRTIVGDPEGKTTTAYNNIVPIVANTIVHLIYCVNNSYVLHTQSSDQGVTWAPSRNITGMVKRPGWGWMATGPGHGIELQSGRLVVPYNTFFADSKAVQETVQTGCFAARECRLYNNTGPQTLETKFTITNTADATEPPRVGKRNLSLIEPGALVALPPYVFVGDTSGVLYSDDAGMTWHRGGQTLDRIGSSECVAAELVDESANNTLLLSFRVEDADTRCRKFARSGDGGLSFEPHYEPEGCIPDPVCQGSLLGLDGGNVLLTSGPASSVGRHNIVIHVSRDRGRSFAPIILVVFDKASTDYSDMVELGEVKDGWKIGVVYAASTGIGFATFVVHRAR